MILSSFTYWSTSHGAEVVRLSAADELGQEFYTFLPSTMGTTGRALRRKAADALSQAIDLGLEPGEIRWA